MEHHQSPCKQQGNIVQLCVYYHLFLFPLFLLLPRCHLAKIDNDQMSDTKYSHRSSAYNSAESLPYLPYECTCAFLIISRVSEGKELFLFYTRFICKFQTALKKIKFQLRRSYLESGKIDISGLFHNFTGVRSASKKAI